MSKLSLQKTFDRVEIGFFFALALILPVHNRSVAFGLALFFLFLLIKGFALGFRKPPLQYLFFPALFLLYLIGLIYTQNTDFARSDLETRSSLLLLPLLIGITKRDNLPSYFLPIISWLFVLGLIIFEIYCYKLAYECYEGQRNRFCFESSAISGGVHPTYLSLQLIFGAFLIVNDAIKNKRQWLIKIAAGMVLANFLHFSYKLYSVGPWISLLGMLAVILFVVFYYRRKLLWYFGIMTGLLVLGYLAVSNLDLLNSDYRVIKSEVGEYLKDSEAYINTPEEECTSVRSRIVLWTLSIEFVAKHPFGAGTGDVKDDLLSYYRERGKPLLAERKLNPHNQYLQTTAAVGWLGLILLIGAFLYYIRFGANSGALILVGLSSLFAFGCLFESLFERQWGIVFFSFFLVALLVSMPSDEETSKEIS